MFFRDALWDITFPLFMLIHVVFSKRNCASKTPKTIPRCRSSNRRTIPGSVFRSETASGAFWIPFGIFFPLIYRFGKDLGSFLAPVWPHYSRFLHAVSWRQFLNGLFHIYIYIYIVIYIYIYIYKNKIRK